jgi:hypothetical protein
MIATTLPSLDTRTQSPLPKLMAPREQPTDGNSHGKFSSEQRTGVPPRGAGRALVNGAAFHVSAFGFDR